MPATERSQAKQIIVNIIRTAGGEFTGKTKLYKTFYIAHLYYTQMAPDILTEWPIVRMPNGPGIDQGEALLDELVEAEILTREPEREGPYPTTKYRLTDKAADVESLSDIATDAVRSAVEYTKPRTAAELSELTHEHSRSWNKATNGHEMNIYIDLIADEEYGSRRSDLKKLDADISAVFGESEKR